MIHSSLTKCDIIKHVCITLWRFQNLRDEAPGLQAGGRTHFVPVTSLDDDALLLNFVPIRVGIKSFTFLWHKILPLLYVIGKRTYKLGRGIGRSTGACKCGHQEQEEGGPHFGKAQGYMVATLTLVPLYV